jgi:hypothetical protein
LVIKNKINNMTNNDHRRTAYTMTKKKNKKHDKKRSQKDRQHNDQKKDIQHNGQKKRTDNTMAKNKGQTTQWPKDTVTDSDYPFSIF